MDSSIFKEYDIRGRVGTEIILDHVYDLAAAIAYYFLKEHPATKMVAVAMDGRLSSPEIKKQIIKAFIDSGLDVIDIGLCPTPVLYYSLFTLDVEAGIMITASHNPKDYNGLKIVLDKKVVWGKELKVIGQLYEEGHKIAGSQKGRLQTYPIIHSYVQFLAAHFPELKKMQLSAVIDCGNGAAGSVLPELIRAMEWQQVQLLYEEVDGTYPNHEADPVVEKNMQAVKKNLATTPTQVGIGLDGDCDRMAAMTKPGYLVPGDKLLAVFAKSVIEETPDAKIICDVKCSSGLAELIKKWGGQLIFSPAGHAIIKDQMAKHHAILAGELSCHFFFHDRYFGYDDGIYAMMRLFEILTKTEKTLDDLIAEFPKKVSTSEIRFACPDEKKQVVIDQVRKTFSGKADAELITIDGVRVQMPYGWGIIRASNTQPVLSMRFESDTKEDLKKIKQDFVAILSMFFDRSELEQLG